VSSTWLGLPSRAARDDRATRLLRDAQRLGVAVKVERVGDFSLRVSGNRTDLDELLRSPS